MNPDDSFFNSLHSNGKIYVVVAVIAVIFIGLIAYLISIDRKVSKFEREANDKNESEKVRK